MASVDVLSVISGTVWKIEKKVGDTVHEDEPIIIVESMKMEIPIMSPEDGTVLTLLVKEGEAVSENQVVATIEI